MTQDGIQPVRPAIEKEEKSKFGTIAIGIRAPIIMEGDDIVKTVVNSIADSKIELEDGDIIGITESVVARAFGAYATVDDIANDIRMRFVEASGGADKSGRVILINPIYSRNRFATILRGIARAAEEVYIVMPDFDEVGNPRCNHPFTMVNYDEMYAHILNEEHVGVPKIFDTIEACMSEPSSDKTTIIIDCGLHNFEEFETPETGAPCVVGNHIHISKVLSDRTTFGVLGSNATGDGRIKLFPSRELSISVVKGVQELIIEYFGVHVECLIYGDGCFHSPHIPGVIGSSINEFADPVTSPAYTDGLEGCPSEVKIKAIADSEAVGKLRGEELNDLIKNIVGESSKRAADKTNGKEPYNSTLGTTPRRYIDQVVSLCDLVTGSGQKGTPIVVLKNYFKSYAD